MRCTLSSWRCAVRNRCTDGYAAAANSKLATSPAPTPRPLPWFNRGAICSLLGRVGLEAPVANTRAIRRGVLIDQRALPDCLQVRRQPELVYLARAEAAELASDPALHLVLDFRARQQRLVVSNQQELLVERAALDLIAHHIGVVVQIIRRQLGRDLDQLCRDLQGRGLGPGQATPAQHSRKYGAGSEKQRAASERAVRRYRSHRWFLGKNQRHSRT